MFDTGSSNPDLDPGAVVARGDMASPAPVRDDVAAFLQAVRGKRALETLTPQQVREILRNVKRDLPAEPIEARALVLPQTRATARVYDPREDKRAASVVVLFIHGGGWVLSDLDNYEAVCTTIARHLNLPVVSIHYPLAPEYPYPAAPDACESAVRWIAASPRGLGFTPTAIVLAGDSAGGNLALVTALALRDKPIGS